MYRYSQGQAIKKALLAIIMAVFTLYALAMAIATIFSATHVWVLKQSAMETAVVGLAFALVASFSSYGFYHSVISIKSIAKHLEKQSFSLVLKRRALTGSRGGLEIEVNLDRPFMDYWPVPRTVIVTNNGRSEISKNGSWNPQYMYHLGRAYFKKRLDPGANAPQVETVLSKYNDTALLDKCTVCDGQLEIELKIGSWMGSALLQIMDDVIQAINI